MASQWPPKKNTAFTLYFTLYKNDGTVIANPGTYTKKVSIDGAAVADITASVTEEDTTYGQLSIVLSTSEMNGDAIWVQIKDDTSGCVPFTCTLYTAANTQDGIETKIDGIETHVHTPSDSSGVTEILTRLPDATAGANGGLVICGSNAAITFASLTSTGAFTVGSIVNGGVFAQTGAVTFTGGINAGTISGTLANDIITAASINTGAFTADAFADDSIVAATIAADVIAELNADVLTAIGGIGSGTGAALNFAPSDDNVDGAITNAPTFDPAVPFVGSQTSGTFASVAGDDETYHQIDDTANEIDIVYQFNIGSGRNCAKIVFTGYMGTSTADTCVIKAYNFLTGAWDTRSTLIGQNNSTDKVQDITLLSAHTGTGTHAGKVYLRFDSSASNQVLYVDSLIAQAQNLGTTVGYADGAIWIGGANTGTTPYVDGTADNPVTYAAAKTLSTSTGLTRFRVRNGTTITLDASIASQTFIGNNWTLALGGQSIANAHIEGASVSGVSSGEGATLVCCYIGTVTIDSADFLNCCMNGTFTTVSSGSYNFVQCLDGIPGETNAVIVLTANVLIGMRLWSGGININSIAATNIVVIDGAGKLILDSNCVAGEIRLRGPFAVTDNVEGGFAGTLTQTERYNTTTLSDVIKTAIEVNGSKIDHLWEMTEDDGGTRRLTANALEEAPTGGAAPTAATIADAVWDEAIADHTTATTFGGKNQKVVPSESVNDYKATGFSTHSASDVASLILVTPAQKIVTDANGYVTYANTAPPSASTISTQVASDLQSAHGSGAWTTATGFATLTNVTDAVTAIESYGDIHWVTATGFSTLTQADIRTATGLYAANLGDQLIAIVADTDELQKAWTSGGRLDVVLNRVDGGSSLNTYVHTVTKPDLSTPIPNTYVIVSTDIVGQVAIASGTSDAFGHITFYIDPGTYYFWNTCEGYDFSNPEVVVVP